MGEMLRPGVYTFLKDRRRVYTHRQGENPFSRELNVLVKRRGYRTDEQLASEIEVSNNQVWRWRSGKNHPSHKYKEKLLQVLTATDEEREALNIAWDQYQDEKKASSSRNIRDIKTRSRQMMPPQTLLGRWIVSLTTELNISNREFEKRLGYSSSSFRWRQSGLSLITASDILQRAPTVFSLTSEQIESLGEAIGETIAQMIESGKTVQSVAANSVRRLQKEASCVTFTSGQLADRFGVSPQYIRQLRESLGIDHLLFTEEDVSKIESRLNNPLNSPGVTRRGNRSQAL